MKIILGFILSVILVGCTVAPRTHEPPYEWQTVEGLKEARNCVMQCPTANSCNLSYFKYCMTSAKQLDMMYAEIKKGNK